MDARARVFYKYARLCPRVQGESSPQPRWFRVNRKTDSGRLRYQNWTLARLKAKFSV
jgi:hypothetical protein